LRVHVVPPRGVNLRVVVVAGRLSLDDVDRLVAYPGVVGLARLGGCVTVDRHTGAGGRLNVGKNRKEAQRARVKLRGQIVTDEYQALQNITFREWADQWKATLKRPKENTLR
jgi:hypothetical protein